MARSAKLSTESHNYYSRDFKVNMIPTISPIPTGLRNSPHHLRRRINQLANPGTYDSIMESLIEISEAQEQQISVEVDFTSFPDAMVELNSEEQNVRLLIWHAKSRLYAHALNLPENRPLTYNSFTNHSLENSFWQDVYLFHLQAPWAKHADARAGIQTVLVIDRTNGEKDIISKEFKCAMSWAVELHTSIRAKLEDSSLDLGECEEEDKLALVKSMLEEELLIHESLMRSWAGDVLELWKIVYGIAPLDHPWFRLINSLPPPRVHVVEDQQIEVRSEDIIQNLDEGDENAGSDDVDGEEIRAEDLLNLLNIASGDPATDE
ncbi:hypothetical protein KEM48_013548 [Puccinia striiformis f. sp. tritici PST-130]|uniref:Uncharacterized protein n=1 Tax=Puccinia striiformis f. sp. tritici PST-78 TaxID=1165861 RepID=A0A0L0UQY4_9BASI|nr:hypothetical protein KEM48_013548 [Puccinia striiformis f. sp. tritici PST-130]KNE89482.1 hypothetical protein PSTG_17055 [Puccinia striiformis f. sp. tritici PST-78]